MPFKAPEYADRRRLRTVCTVAAFSLLAAGLFVPAVADERPGMAQFVRMRWPSRGTVAADGTFYCVHNPTGVYQLHKRSPGSSSLVALTDFADGVSDYNLSPDGRWIIFAASKGGNEQNDLHLLNTADDTITPLLVDPDTVFGSVVWRHDSKAFAYRANLDRKKDFNVYHFDLASRATRKVFDRDGYYFPTDYSPDGKRLMILQYHSATHTQLFEVDLAGASVREISPEGEAWTYNPFGYGADGKSFLVGTDYQADLMRLRRLDLSSRTLLPLRADLDAFEVDDAVWNSTRTVLAVLLNEDGYRSLHLLRMPAATRLPVPDMARGIVSSVGFSGDSVVFSLSNARTPNTTYRWSLSSPGVAPMPLTHPDTQGIDVSQFTLPELIRYPTFDRKIEVPAFLYLPQSYAPDTPIPFIVSYHGGPEGQYRPYFSKHFQYFLSRGFGVLAPNVRGSSGYGKRYLEMDNYKNRNDSVMDGVWAARWLVEKGYSKPGMIGAYGGSYGGFMSVATVAQAPDLFGASCDVVGIVNFKTFLERTKDYRRKVREAEYGPLTDPVFLESISPIHLVDRITTPMLIAHGRNDPRVPLHEAEQLHAALRDRDRTVELLVFDDEGHGFRKEKNRIVFYEALADFFERYLVPRGG